MITDFNAWEADLAAGTATHASGFVLKVEGNPKDPSSVDPGKFPADLNFIDQARLLRSGLEFLAKAAVTSGASYGNWQPESQWQTSSKADEAKMAAIKEREALAQRFAERTDKPKRSVLSLKKEG